MNHRTIRRQVSLAVGQQWPDFAEKHPRLAEILDEEIIADHVTDRLEDDPAYQEAMADAAATGRASEALRTIVDRFIARFLRNLLRGR